ncbi:MAG: hypothetical protein FK733_07260 [Asgard group archaeon]|nr:hypothetical protein [Asgard group archaeon]
MGMCETDKYHTIAALRKKMVKSVDDLDIGHVIDVVFNEEFQIHSFILGGSRWEEFRERLGIIDDIDPVIDVSTIRSIDEDVIQLSIAKSRIPHKLQEDVIPENAFIYSSMKRKKIVDTLENKFGKIVNLGVLPCGEPIFVIGGTWFEELSERLGFKENVDLLLPSSKIESIDEKTIKLNVPLDKLNLTVDNKPMTAEEQREYFNSLKVKGAVEVRLLERSQVAEFKQATEFH